MTIESYLEQRNLLQDALWPKVALLPGVRKLVLHLKAHRIPIAVATGSRRRNYELKTAHLEEVFGSFGGKVVCADDQQYTMRGKPEPDIFLVAAREVLGRNVGYPTEPENEEHKVQRANGLVFEDALLGLQAGKRAGMSGASPFHYYRTSTTANLAYLSVVWVPDANLLDLGNTGEEQADQTLRSIEDFVPEEWGLPPYTS